ncbi:MAG: hypothetical protein COB29_01225 [Sulfitobacter sp.]|nr:MAG: hypothetical protein COB29_01225 [Sulfitobacter sp.]
MFDNVVTSEPSVPSNIPQVDDEGDDVMAPVFVDQHGNFVRVHDTVAVEFTDPGNPVYQGEVTDINRRDGTFNVQYFDDDREEHHMIEGDSEAVSKSLVAPLTVDHTDRMRGLSTAGDKGSRGANGGSTWNPKHVPHPSKYVPHPSVQEYLDGYGDVRIEYLHGDKTLPPMPDMPNYTRANAPEDPATLAEAFATVDALYWLHAVLKEYHGHVKPARRPPTFHTTSMKSKGRQLFAKWVLSCKWVGDRLEKFKARVVIAAFGLEQGRDFVESYVGCAPISDLRDLEVMALHYGLSVYEIDLTQAYCWMPMPPSPDGEPVIMVPAPGARVRSEDGKVLYLQLDQALYGHPASGFALARGVHDRLINRGNFAEVCPIPFEQSATQPVIFRANFPVGHEFHGEIFWMWIYNDNFRSYTSAPAIQMLFRSWFASVFDITGGSVPLQQQDPQQCLGMEIRYLRDSVSFTMPAFVRKALMSAGMSEANAVPTPMVPGFTLSELDVPDTDDERDEVVHKVNVAFRRNFSKFTDVTNFYRSLVSSVGWIAKQVAPVLSLAVSILGRAMHAPCWKAFTAVKRLYRYLRGHEDIALTYVKTRDYDWRNRDFLVYEFKTDASFADDRGDCKSQGGYTGGPKGTAVTTYSSTKSKRVCTSTFQAESAHAFHGCKEVVYKFHLFTFLDVVQAQPIVLYMDNAATVLAAGSLIRKFSPASKHFDIEQKYVVQCVEDGIVTVVHMPGSIDSDRPVPGDGFCADAMTKPLPSIILDCYFTEMQGPSRGGS